MREASATMGRQELATGSEGHRLDIEGLRALAVALVILFHAGVPLMEGGYVGVDVFFVLSGFLITGLLVREMERTGSVDLRRFYARRIRRLLPASVVALAGAVAIAYFALPITRWRGISTDVVWSALYAVNWRFAQQAVDYLAADAAPSPVLHFWSLAVEEQFYLVWPFMLLAVTVGARRRFRGVRKPLVAGLMAVALPSFAWSVYLTHTNPGSAYFVTTTRMWELAVGGGLAILAPQLTRIPRALAEALGLVGLFGIVLGAILFDATTLFPGYVALLPVVSTAAVVAAGTANGRTFISRLLRRRTLVVVGGMSYALYLWHWPVLVGGQALWGPLSAYATLLLVAVSVLLAWLSHRLIEQPIRRSSAFVTPPSRALAYGLGLTTVGVVVGLWLSSAVPVPVQSGNQSFGAFPSPGSGVLEANAEQPLVVEHTVESITPDPLEARNDVDAVVGDGCHQPVDSSEPVACSYGLAAGPVVALVGDSHAAQWIPALAAIADEEGFALRTFTKSACPFADIVVAVGEQQLPYRACEEWNRRVVEVLLDTEELQFVVTSGAFWAQPIDSSGKKMAPSDAQVSIENGLVARWSELEGAGIDVVAIRDTPYPRFDVPECVAEHRDSLSECAFDRLAAMAGNGTQGAAAERTGATLVDMTDRICAEDECPAVVNGYLVWRDTHHLTATYSRALAGTLSLRIGEWTGFDRD